MIVTIRTRALDLPRRVAARVRARTGGMGSDLVGRDFGPSRATSLPVRDRVDHAPRRRWPRRLAKWFVALLALSCVAVYGTGYRYRPLPTGSAVSPPPAPASAGDEAALARENRQLHSQIERFSPRGAYIVVDRANNRLYLKRGDEVVLEAVCSSGSGMVLNEPDGDRRWVFDTPSGTFRVLSKTEDPVWRKPDWAFIEEGQPVPRNPDDRIEYGMLGEYGLNFGNGYLIHGTLYERLLGRSVTHGCIRLGRDDLRQVYRAASIGTPIYIY